MSGWDIALALAVPLSALIGGLVTNFVNGRNSKRSTDREFVEELRHWTELRLAERDRRIDTLEADLKSVEAEGRVQRAELETTRVELSALTSKYNAALAYLRRLLEQVRGSVPADQIVPPPLEIEDDL